MERKKRRVWWLVGGVALPVLLFAWAAFAVQSERESLYDEVLTVAKRNGFSEADPAAFDDELLFPKGSATVYTGPRLSKTQGQVLFDELKAAGWHWRRGSGSTNSSTGEWSRVGLGMRISFRMHFHVATGPDDEGDGSLIEFRMYEPTPLKKIRFWLML